jgi:acetyltransferase
LKLLEEMLLRLSQLLSDFPEIEQVDINPFIAGSGREDSFAVDARISLLPA